MPAEQQVKEAVSKAGRLNPGFDGKVRGNMWNHEEPMIESGVVTEIGFITDNVTDISPVRALPGLRKLACHGSAPGKGKLSDLTPLEGLRLIGLNCGWSPLISKPGSIADMPLSTLTCDDTLIHELLSLNGMTLGYLRIRQRKTTPASRRSRHYNAYLWDDPAKTENP